MDSNTGNQQSAPQKTGLLGGLDLTQMLALGLSFAVGIVIVAVVAVSGGNDTASAPADGEQQLARAVGEPSDSFSSDEQDAVGDEQVVAEVAGVACELDPLGTDVTSVDVLESWNSSVVSTGDACVAPFADTLGSAWLMTDAELSIFGEDGSLYEFTSGDSGLESLSIFLVIDDSLNGETTEISSLIGSIWGAENIDWDNGCDATDRPWAGSVSSDGLSIEVLSCVNA